MYVGEVAEWLKVPVWSTGVRVILHRGFESLPLRKFYIAITRARHSVGIIYDYAENDEFEDVEKWNEIRR